MEARRRVVDDGLVPDHVTESIREIRGRNFPRSGSHRQDIGDLHEVQIGREEFMDSPSKITLNLQGLR